MKKPIKKPKPKIYRSKPLKKLFKSNLLGLEFDGSAYVEMLNKYYTKNTNMISVTTQPAPMPTIRPGGPSSTK